jgi:DNA repair protein RecN (Recombination protein N)
LCVTHLPQVAAHAARHFVVTKSFEGEQTASRVTRAEGDARLAELAAMFGGDTEANRAAARELLDARLANAPA